MVHCSKLFKLNHPEHLVHSPFYLIPDLFLLNSEQVNNLYDFSVKGG
jgi:hypothetical protein